MVHFTKSRGSSSSKRNNLRSIPPCFEPHFKMKTNRPNHGHCRSVSGYRKEPAGLSHQPPFSQTVRILALWGGHSDPWTLLQTLLELFLRPTFSLHPGFIVYLAASLPWPLRVCDWLQKGIYQSLPSALLFPDHADAV